MENMWEKKDKASTLVCLAYGFIYYFPIKRERRLLEKWLILSLGQKTYKMRLKQKKERLSMRVVSKGIRNQVEKAPTGQRMGKFELYGLPFFDTLPVYLNLVVHYYLKK